MLQDIAPHKYDNRFLIKRPAADSFAVYIKNRKILLSGCGQELSLPLYRELESPDFSAFEFSDYLFSIDDREFFLIDEERCELRESASLSFYSTGILRGLRPRLTAFSASVGAQLYRFYKSHAYCGWCGFKMEKGTRERSMICPGCKNVEYPRISPAVIVAVTDGDRLLLSKYAEREYKHYALLAGFCEIGETLEQTVKREVMEETGLKVKNIAYYKNQPWPFTDSLLVGFFAELDGPSEIHMDREELAAAEWVRREEIPHDFTDVSLTHEMIIGFRDGIL